jgi:hypothetical protein
MKKKIEDFEVGELYEHNTHKEHDLGDWFKDDKEANLYRQHTIVQYLGTNTHDQLQFKVILTDVNKTDDQTTIRVGNVVNALLESYFVINLKKVTFSEECSYTPSLHQK